ncbi:LacI family DNA-binding transcriptional regulator [Rhodococcus sp. IEGM1428]|uniref:LacI family DNA-binding transcriptional regulator n=1 Tax=Rhodococcus sp. IEGM1428 TaxID=3392191 RepID=UPI003D0F46FC
MTPTIKQVAERAGVSTATVSRALSGSRTVSPELTSRIVSAVEELGYSSNVIASSLRRRRSDTIGMVVPDLANPFFTALVQNVDHELARRGWQVLLCDAQTDSTVEAQRLTSLIERQVDGIIISPTNEWESAPAVRSAAAKVPVVQIDRRARDTDTDWVGIDDDYSQGLIVSHLRQLGVATVAFISATPTDSSSELRQAGFFRHAEKQNLSIIPELVLLGDYSLEWGVESGRIVLASPHRPAAVVCGNDLIALGVLKACRDAGVSVPADIVVTGFDDIPFAALSTPALTTIAQPLEDIALEGVRLLAQAIEGSRHSATVRSSLGSKLVVRESTVRVDPGPL